MKLTWWAVRFVLTIIYCVTCLTASGQNTGNIDSFEIIIDEDLTVDKNENIVVFDFTGISVNKNLNVQTCNFTIRRIKIPEELQEPLASGLLSITEGAVQFLEHRWITGGLADGEVLQTKSNLKFDKKGRLFGVIPVFPFVVSVGEVAWDAKYPELQGKKTPKNLKTPEGSHRFNIQSDWDGELEISLCKTNEETLAYNADNTIFRPSKPIADIHLLEDVMRGAQQDRSIVHVPSGMIQIVSDVADHPTRNGSYSLKFEVNERQSQYPNRGHPRGGAYTKLRGPFMQPLEGKWSHKFSIFIPKETPDIDPADVYIGRISGISGNKYEDLLLLKLGHRNSVRNGREVDNYMMAKWGVDESQSQYVISLGGIYLPERILNGRMTHNLIWPKEKTREVWLDFEIEANWSSEADGYILVKINDNLVHRFEGATKTKTQVVEFSLGITRSWRMNDIYHAFIEADPEQLECFISELKLLNINQNFISRVKYMSELEAYSPRLLGFLKKSTCFGEYELPTIPKQIVYIDEIEFQKLD